jgi:hypothetical protein
MKSISLLFVLSVLSNHAYSGQVSSKEKNERPGIVEKRQSRAKEIMKDNFNASSEAGKTTRKKLNFGFKKNHKEDIQNL